jgi:hypothetical protein
MELPEYLTMTEALVSLLVERDDVDATNAVPMLRAAKRYLVTDRRFTDFEREYPLDVLDDVIIDATRNGKRDLFLVDF